MDFYTSDKKGNAQHCKSSKNIYYIYLNNITFNESFKPSLKQIAHIPFVTTFFCSYFKKNTFALLIFVIVSYSMYLPKKI